MKDKKVSVIVCSLNSERFLHKCLLSVRKQSHKNLELIVIDNGSNDDSRKIVKEDFPEAILIENRENRGFASANNQGIEIAGGDFILFLNADAFLDKDYLKNALKPFALDPAIGMVSGKVLRFDGRTIDSAGEFVTKSRKAVERGYGKQDDGSYDDPGYIFSVCGACALYRRETLERVKVEGEVFDHFFFSFFEDLDLGWRANLLGFRGYYTPDALCYHLRGGSAGQGSILGRFSQLLRRDRDLKYHIVKNRWLTIIKNDRLTDFFCDLPFIALRDFAILISLLFFDPLVILKLIKDSYSLIKLGLEKRQVIKKMAGKNPGLRELSGYLSTKRG
jgi:GT2 family glycosyltransferase